MARFGATYIGLVRAAQKRGPARLCLCQPLVAHETSHSRELGGGGEPLPCLPMFALGTGARSRPSAGPSRSGRPDQLGPSERVGGGDLKRLAR